VIKREAVTHFPSPRVGDSLESKRSTPLKRTKETHKCCKFWICLRPGEIRGEEEDEVENKTKRRTVGSKKFKFWRVPIESQSNPLVYSYLCLYLYLSILQAELNQTPRAFYRAVRKKAGGRGSYSSVVS